MFECDNGRCVAPKQLCDGHDQCGDFSDESGCGMYIVSIDVDELGFLTKELWEIYPKVVDSMFVKDW